jgi:hypothetical protein
VEGNQEINRSNMGKYPFVVIIMIIIIILIYFHNFITAASFGIERHASLVEGHELMAIDEDAIHPTHD